MKPSGSGPALSGRIRDSGMQRSSRPFSSFWLALLVFSGLLFRTPRYHGNVLCPKAGVVFPFLLSDFESLSRMAGACWDNWGSPDFDPAFSLSSFYRLQPRTESSPPSDCHDCLLHFCSLGHHDGDHRVLQQTRGCYGKHGRWKDSHHPNHSINLAGSACSGFSQV